MFRTKGLYNNNGDYLFIKNSKLRFIVSLRSMLAKENQTSSIDDFAAKLEATLQQLEEARLELNDIDKSLPKLEEVTEEPSKPNIAPKKVQGLAKAEKYRTDYSRFDHINSDEDDQESQPNDKKTTTNLPSSRSEKLRQVNNLYQQAIKQTNVKDSYLLYTKAITLFPIDNLTLSECQLRSKLFAGRALSKANEDASEDEQEALKSPLDRNLRVSIWKQRLERKHKTGIELTTDLTLCKAAAENENDTELIHIWAKYSSDDEESKWWRLTNVEEQMSALLENEQLLENKMMLSHLQDIWKEADQSTKQKWIQLFQLHLSSPHIAKVSCSASCQLTCKLASYFKDSQLESHLVDAALVVQCRQFLEYWCTLAAPAVPSKDQWDRFLTLIKSMDASNTSPDFVLVYSLIGQLALFEHQPKEWQNIINEKVIQPLVKAFHDSNWDLIVPLLILMARLVERNKAIFIDWQSVKICIPDKSVSDVIQARLLDALARIFCTKQSTPLPVFTLLWWDWAIATFDTLTRLPLGRTAAGNVALLFGNVCSLEEEKAVYFHKRGLTRILLQLLKSDPRDYDAGVLRNVSIATAKFCSVNEDARNLVREEGGMKLMAERSKDLLQGAFY